MFKKQQKSKQTPSAPIENNKKENLPINSIESKNWIEEEEEEGELLVDVYQEDDNIVIKSTVAGVKPEDLDIDINNDMITIRGKRKQIENINSGDFFYQECYWGSFSRSIILPCEVYASKAKASLKDGVLKIVLPKSQKERSVKLSVS
jgi:HSP20 family protein